MKIKFYLNSERFLAGVTLKDQTEPENGNMALHVCEDPELVLRNRRQLASALNCELNDFVCGSQTHSANFYQVTAADKGRGSDCMKTAIPNTDALFTYEPDLLLCCFTADCVPVFFYHEVTGLVGVIHSGWQGTVKEITRKVLEYLKQKEHCDPADLHIFIGVALSQKKFEVGEEVYEQFRALGYADDFIYCNEETGKFHVDNRLVVKKQCELQGVRPDIIIVDPTCTDTNPDGFSYRRDHQCGRHMSFIMRKDV